MNNCYQAYAGLLLCSRTRRGPARSTTEVRTVARDVTKTYPTRAAYAPWPFMLSLIAGVLILLEGVLVVMVGPFLTTAGDLGFGTLIFGIVIFVFGLIVIWAAYGLRADPGRQVAYGAVVAIVSVLALVLAGGGFIIGSLLGIIGGAWAIMQR